MAHALFESGNTVNYIYMCKWCKCKIAFKNSEGVRILKNGGFVRTPPCNPLHHKLLHIILNLEAKSEFSLPNFLIFASCLCKWCKHCSNKVGTSAKGLRKLCIPLNQFLKAHMAKEGLIFNCSFISQKLFTVQLQNQFHCEQYPLKPYI